MYGFILLYLRYSNNMKILLLYSLYITTSSLKKINDFIIISRLYSRTFTDILACPLCSVVGGKYK